ncbi:MAG: TfoX/Sxy family protein [Oscillospiraceae bacterium]|jgi:TfoX/Sxy family transcriptional regulator of competence genes|nr:TfoX/Sxy family protein [Oscillospiraceae bacterium]
MSSKPEFVEYVAGQLAGAGEISCRRMFGEYGIHMDGKYLACICGDQLFVKPTAAGRAVLVEPTEAPPYEGAGITYFLIEDVEDTELLRRLFTATWADLPFPKQKKKKEK